MKIKYCTDSSHLKLFKQAWENATDLVVGFDTETTGLSAHSSKLRLLQFAIGSEVYIIDCFKIEDVFKKVDSILDLREDITLVGQNLKFDIQFLWANRINFEHLQLFDTMISAQILAMGLSLGFGLDDIVARYLNIHVSKDEQKSDWSILDLTESQLRYAAIDVLSVKQLYPILKSLIEKESLQELFNLEHRTLYATAAMEFFGVKCNKDKIAEMRPFFENKLKEAEKTFLSTITERYKTISFSGKVVHEGLELSSSSQVLRGLQSLGVKDPLEPDKILQSTGSNHLKLIDNAYDYPGLAALFDYRKASKLLTAYIYSLPNLINPVTERLHTNYRQMVSTGRFSSSSPNLQQMPRPSKDNPVNIREAFQPEPGYVFVQADFSQIELRVMAEVVYVSTGDRAMLDEFIEGKDPYTNTAALLMGYDYYSMFEEGSLKPEYKPLRQSAKAVRLGLNYAMQAPKLRTYSKQTYGVDMSEQEARLYRERYFDSYKGLALYHESCDTRELRDRPIAYSLEPFKRPRVWEDYPGPSGLSNHPIQGSSADITKLAMSMIYERLFDLGYSPTQSHDIKPVLTIHDEVVLEAKEHLVELASTILQESMIGAAQVVLKICPVEAEVNIMKSLAEK